MQTPVALIVFNRPDLTARLFEIIAQVKPRKLLVISDAPRPNRPDEAEKVAATRAIFERIDWDCELLTKYASVNLGHMHGPLSGINWVFEQVEEAIILEDDCLPDLTFFRFCAELLDRYRYDERVMMISGDNLLLGKKLLPYSYCFSRHGAMWGWATWRRAWKLHDPELKAWPALKNTGFLLDNLIDTRIADYWHTQFDEHYGRGADVPTWDTPWTFALWANNGLSITPATNLISNLGFRADASHTTGSHSPLAALTTAPMQFPLRHPPYVVRDREADVVTFRNVTPISFAEKPGLYRRIRRKAFMVLPQPLRQQIIYLRSRLFSS